VDLALLNPGAVLAADEQPRLLQAVEALVGQRVAAPQQEREALGVLGGGARGEDLVIDLVEFDPGLGVLVHGEPP